MTREVKTPGKQKRVLLGWLPIASLYIIAWINAGTSTSLRGMEAGDISFQVRDVYLFSLPLFMEHERAALRGISATEHLNDDHEIMRKLLQLNAETYFRELNKLLAEDGIEVPKTGAFWSLASVGVGPGQDFRLANLPRERMHAIQAGYEQGQALLLDQINQFRQDPLGAHFTYGPGVRVTAHSSKVAHR